MKHFYHSLTFLAIILLCGCSNGKKINKRYPLQIGDKTIEVQIAMTSNEHSKGLMHKKSLGPDQGMLFVFDKPKQQSFWMKNTFIPLDIGFFSPDLVLREVYSMQPQNRNPISSHSYNTMYALEMNEGFFNTNELPPGSRLNQESLAEALNDRVAQ